MKDKLILDNLGLINKAMKSLNCQYSNKEEFDELYYAGLIGLIKSANLYDTTHTSSTYLYKSICNEIKNLFREKTTMKRYRWKKEVSLDQELTEEGATLENLLPSDENIETDYITKELKQRVRNGLNRLKEKNYKTFIKEYYGIDTQPKSMQKIALKYGVSRQCVQQGIERGMKHLKKELEKEFKNERKNNELFR